MGELISLNKFKRTFYPGLKCTGAREISSQLVLVLENLTGKALAVTSANASGLRYPV
jgi:tRNA A37 threonylcarbamoyladenosine synthetase subunit TsaC/SUA5/YrdC